MATSAYGHEYILDEVEVVAPTGYVTAGSSLELRAGFCSIGPEGDDAES